jgi:hypothetical protein
MFVCFHDGLMQITARSYPVDFAVSLSLNLFKRFCSAINSAGV